MSRGMRRAAIIVNERARLGGRADWRDAVARELQAHYDIAISLPSSSEETMRAARAASDAGADLVVAAGGDGTVNAVANGLVASDGDAALGVLPLGTANDFARELRLPGDVRACSARLATGTAREVDVVLVNSSRIFVGVGGLALVSRIALGVTRMKEGSRLTRAIASALGAVVYRFAATSSLLGWRPVNDSMRLTYREPEKGEERTTAVRGAALFVTNHRTLGGGLTLPVAAAADDGILELCVVPERARHSLLVNFARLSAGAPIAPGVIVTIPATEALVETEHEDTFVADGEPLATGRRFELRVLRRALRVIA